MPDGVNVHECWVNEDLLLCATGTALEIDGKSKKLMGKLCLLPDALIMLQYEGAWLIIGELMINELQGVILGDDAEMAGLMEKLGLIDTKANYENLDKTLVWPLCNIEAACQVEVHSFLGMSRVASLHIPMNGKDYAFQMANRGYGIEGFSSAQDFCEAIQHRQYESLPYC